MLSNNDGCVISRSNEAKQLGIPMGEPFFKLRDLVREHEVVALSSNFALYGDLSARVMSIITHYFPEVAIYSIDEAFIDLTSLQRSFDVYKSCVELGQNIQLFTGIPVSIGIGATKTLSKVANQTAKDQKIVNRVFYLDAAEKTSKILEKFDIRDVWGIGRKLAKKLNAMGVFTVQELLQLPEPILHTNFNVVMRRTIAELRGVSCIELRDSDANKQQIMVSRSFGQRVTELSHLQEALATYASNACEKLRAQGSVAGGVCVFLHTGLHGSPETVYKNSLYVKLTHRSADTRFIIQQAKDGLQQMFRHGFRYKKIGIILCDLIDAQNMQIDIFGHADLKRSEELMVLMDAINQRFGRATVQFAAAGLEKTWRGQSARRTEGFTASWQELPLVRLQD